MGSEMCIRDSSMGGGAWPFLVGGVICLVNSVNERAPSLLIIARVSFVLASELLRGTTAFLGKGSLGQ